MAYSFLTSGKSYAEYKASLEKKPPVKNKAMEIIKSTPPSKELTSYLKEESKKNSGGSSKSSSGSKFKSGKTKEELIGIPESGTTLTQASTPEAQGFIPLEKQNISSLFQVGVNQQGTQVKNIGLNLEKQYADFATKYGGRELNPQEYEQARAARLELVAQQRAYEKAYQDYQASFERNVARAEGEQKQKELESFVKPRSLADKPVLMPGQQGYEDPIIIREKSVEEIKKENKKLPKTIDVGVSSKTRYTQLTEGQDKYITPGKEGIYTKAQLEKIQEGYVGSAQASIVTPEDILFYSPLSGRFTQGVLGLAKVGVKKIAPNLSKIVPGFFKTTVVKGSERIKAFEERTVQGAKMKVEGAGQYFYKTTSKAKELLGLKPKKIVEDISYKFNVVEKAGFPKGLKITSTGLANVSPGQELLLAQQYKVKMGVVPKALKGEPFTLGKKVSQEGVEELINKRLDLRAGLRGESQFVSEGFVDLLKKGKVADRSIIKEFSRVVGKKEPTIIVKPTSVFVKPGQDIPSKVSFTSRIKSFGEGTSQGRVSGVLFDKDFGKYSQVVVDKSKKILVTGNVAPGQVSDVFKVDKVPAFNFSSLKTLSGNKFGEMSVAQQVQASVSPSLLKFSSFSGLSKVVPDTKSLLSKINIKPPIVPVPLIFKPINQTSPIVKSVTEPKVVSVSKVNKTTISPLVNIKQSTEPVFKIDTKDKLKVGSGSKNSLKQLDATETKQLVDLGEKVDVAQSTKVDTKLAVGQALRYNQAQKLKQLPIYKQPIIPKINLSKPTGFKIPIPVPIPFKFPSFKTRPFSDKLKSSGVKAYDVLVRKKGKFVKVASKLPIARATRYGAFVTDVGSSARTFRLEEAGTTRLKDIKKVDLSRFRTPSKRSSLKGPLTFIEKSKYAISSSAEKREIPGMARIVAKRNTLRQVRL